MYTILCTHLHIRQMSQEKLLEKKKKKKAYHLIYILDDSTSGLSPAYINSKNPKDDAITVDTHAAALSLFVTHQMAWEEPTRVALDVKGKTKLYSSSKKENNRHLDIVLE